MRHALESVIPPFVPGLRRGGTAAVAAPEGKHIPIGLELFSVRDQLAKDPHGTVAAVAKMGYQVVEFFAPYFSWTPITRSRSASLMDDAGIRCNSTHNGPPIVHRRRGLEEGR